MAGITQNYHETLAPFSSSFETAATLAATYVALIPAARYAQLGTQFFNVPGRKLFIRMHGQITTGATPGNLQIGVLFGTGANNNGVTLAAGAAIALTASQTNVPFEIEMTIRSTTTLGATGTLFARGVFRAGAVVMATTLNLVPATAPAVSAACDLTGTLIPSIQALRSGSTAETMQVLDYDFAPLN